MKKTALYDWHKQAKAKIVEFGGWAMPVSYEGVLAEHQTVRTACGVFDVSHMGEIFVKGPEAAAFLNHLTVNDIERLGVGQGQYTAMLYEDGGMIDDLIVYRLKDAEYLLCVNAGNTEKDAAWIEKEAAGWQGVSCDNQSSEWSQFALQGPTSKEIMLGAVSATDRKSIEKLDYMEIFATTVAGHSCLVARTGYTGEFGYEIYLPKAGSQEIWQSLFAQGKELKPCGLGARDTLRLEACYPLYGNDMDEKVTPLAAGIKWAVRLEKKDFIGKAALEQKLAAGELEGLYAFKMDESGIPRHGMDIYIRGEHRGLVTSGSVLPTVGGAGGLARLVGASITPETEIEIDVRGKRKLARIVKRPLYSPRVR